MLMIPYLVYKELIANRRIYEFSLVVAYLAYIANLSRSRCPPDAFFVLEHCLSIGVC